MRRPAAPRKKVAGDRDMLCCAEQAVAAYRMLGSGALGGGHRDGADGSAVFGAPTRLTSPAQRERSGPPVELRRHLFLAKSKAFIHRQEEAHCT